MLNKLLKLQHFCLSFLLIKITFLLFSGGSQCTCPVKIFPAAFASYSNYIQSERNKICSKFCRSQHFTLRGCSKCALESHYFPPLRSHEDHSFLQSQYNADAQEIKSGQEQIKSLSFDIPVTDPTPDWNRLCLQLCRQGTGGILCNCDLAPF